MDQEAKYYKDLWLKAIRENELLQQMLLNTPIKTSDRLKPKK